MCLCVYLEGFGHAVVISRLLCREAFMGSVASVAEARFLLKLVHAVMSLLCEVRINN